MAQVNTGLPLFVPKVSNWFVENGNEVFDGWSVTMGGGYLMHSFASKVKNTPRIFVLVILAVMFLALFPIRQTNGYREYALTLNIRCKVWLSIVNPFCCPRLILMRHNT